MFKGLSGVIRYCITQKDLVSGQSDEFYSKINNLEISFSVLQNIVHILSR